MMDLISTASSTPQRLPKPCVEQKYAESALMCIKPTAKEALGPGFGFELRVNECESLVLPCYG